MMQTSAFVLFFFRLIWHDALQNLLAAGKFQSKSLRAFEDCLHCLGCDSNCLHATNSVLNALMNHNFVPPI